MFRPIPHAHELPQRRFPNVMNASYLYIASSAGLKTYCVEDDFPRLVDCFPIDYARSRWLDHPADRLGVPPIESTAERLRHEAEPGMWRLRKIAGRLRQLLDENPDSPWAFAAPGEINDAILDGRPSRYHARLTENLREDLFHAPEEELPLRLDLHAVPNH
jgi:hypothetical protein